MDDAKQVIRRWERLKGDRANHERVWQDIAEVCRPWRADFTIRRADGQKRGDQQYDGTAAAALKNLGAGLWSMVTNSATKWFDLQHPDPNINADQGVRLWLEHVGSRMGDAFQANGQRFYSEAQDFYEDLSAFGTAIMWVDEAASGGRLTFSNRALSECCIAQNDEEKIDTVVRQFEWTAEQAWMHWGDKAPEAVRKHVEKDPDRRFTFLHAVMPNRGFLPKRLDYKGKPWVSCYICKDSGEEIQRGGFNEFPYMVARWSNMARSIYGESPAMVALTDIKVLNAMEKTQLVAAQKAADPPLLAADEDVLSTVRMTPSGITYGAISAEGRPLVMPLQTGASFNLTLEMAQERRNAIREAFHYSLLLMTQNANATATEVMARQEEKLRLMGPHLGRICTEFLDPLIERCYQIMTRGGAFMPPPEVLMQAPQIKVEYVSPLAKAQRSAEAGSILRTMQAVLPMAEQQPDLLENFDMDKVVRGLADGFGAPAELLRDPRQIAEARAQRAQMKQIQQMATLAQPLQQGAQGMKAMAEAGAIAQQAQQPQGAPA